MTPDPGHIAAVQRRLRASQGPFVPKPRLPIVDEVVATVLSQHTSDHNSERAFAQLKAKFPEQLAARGGADAIRPSTAPDARPSAPSCRFPAHPRSPHRRPAGLDPARDYRGPGAPHPVPGRAAGHPL